MTETPEEVRVRQTATALRLLPTVFENPLRLPGQTCITCSGPLDILPPHCSQCARAFRSWPSYVADIVVPLTYAGPRNPQAQQDLRQYKDGRAPEIRANAAYRLSYLVWHFTAYHELCMRRINGDPHMVALVPSGHTSGRPDPHPLVRLDYLDPTLERVAMTRTRDAIARQVDPESLRIDSNVTGATVLLLDDTWTSGASTQGVAVALRQAGASKVNALVIGRWLNGNWGPTESLLRNNPPRPWNPHVCPVTGGPCP